MQNNTTRQAAHCGPRGATRGHLRWSPYARPSPHVSKVYKNVPEIPMGIPEIPEIPEFGGESQG